MTKSDAIRSALKSARHPLTLDQLRPRIERSLRQIIGRQKLYTLLSVMIAARELDTVGRGDSRFYWFR